MNDMVAERKIWEGKKKAFLVRDKSVQDSKAPFLEFLRSEGYSLGFYKGNHGCGWVHVDISTKQFAYGMPGVEIVGAIGNHAITIEEFMTIYKIFKKYEGLDVLKMTQEEQAEFDRMYPVCKMEKIIGCNKLTHEILHDYLCSDNQNRERFPWERCGMAFRRVARPLERNSIKNGIHYCWYQDRPIYFGMGLAEPDVTDDMLENGEWCVYTLAE